jgi:hypothetical protein
MTKAFPTRLRGLAALFAAIAVSSHPAAAQQATGNPVITAANVTTPVVQIGVFPAEPEISFTFQTGPTGLANAGFVFTNPLGQEYTVVWADEYAPVSGTLNIKQPFQALSAWAPSGEYQLTQVGLADYIGNSTTYTGAQLQSLFKNTVFRVENANADNALPTILKGRILTPSVSLSDGHAVFQAELTVYDAVSGVGFINLGLSSADGNYPGNAGGWTPSPLRGKPGTATVAANFTGASYLSNAVGTWVIANIEVRNYAGTATTISDPALIQAIFGTTTFQLTQ